MFDFLCFFTVAFLYLLFFLLYWLASELEENNRHL